MIFSPTVGAIVHNLLEWTAIFVGVRLYLRNSKTSLAALGQTRNYAILFGCVAGAAIGARVVHWIHRADQWSLVVDTPWLVLQGQSIVGALLGGLVGVELGKKAAGLSESTGDRFVIPLLVGILIGRTGCFLAGLQDDTYGIATTLPWGVDFGDGVARHPTQLYDMVFAVAALFAWSKWRALLSHESGLGFKLLLCGYLAFRFVVDGYKPIPHSYAGLSGIQLCSALGLLAYLPFTFRQAARWRRLQRLTT